MDFTKNIRNDLFRRNEVEFVLVSETNPNFNDTKKLVSEEVSKPVEFIEVYGIKGSFGSKNFVVKAYIYDSLEALEKAKQLTQKQRKVIAEEKKKEEEEKKAEEDARIAEEEKKKAEEKKEEVVEASTE